MKIKIMYKWMLVTFVFLSALVGVAQAEDKPNVVATFSIWADIVKQVGGDKINVTSLVKAGKDHHVFVPTPREVRAIKGADLLVLNGFYLEEWAGRLMEAANYQGAQVYAAQGVPVLMTIPHYGYGHRAYQHKQHTHDHKHNTYEDDYPQMFKGLKTPDPHIWQNPTHVVIGVNHIKKALSELMPEHQSYFEKRAATYTNQLNELDRQFKAAMAPVPETDRVVVVAHRAFDYLGAAYGIKFDSVLGLSTDSDISAKEMARVIKGIKMRKAKVVFLEATSDSRLSKQIAKESKTPVGGVLYSGTLAKKGEASTYLGMMRYNMRLLAKYLGGDVSALKNTD